MDVGVGGQHQSVAVQRLGEGVVDVEKDDNVAYYPQSGHHCQYQERQRCQKDGLGDGCDGVDAKGIEVPT